jgi:hypothetical protein
VNITADEKNPGYFDVSMKANKLSSCMHPVESRTGAIRLEDPKRGAMWLQLGNKSMLMSQQAGPAPGRRMHEPGAAAVAEALRRTRHPALLEPLPRLPN